MSIRAGSFVKVIDSNETYPFFKSKVDKFLLGSSFVVGREAYIELVYKVFNVFVLEYVEEKPVLAVLFNKQFSASFVVGVKGLKEVKPEQFEFRF